MNPSSFEWPVVILACGHPASRREAMRQSAERWCDFCCKWIEVAPSYAPGGLVARGRPVWIARGEEIKRLEKEQ